MHALFINSEFCLWKVNKCRLKKRGKHRKWKRRCIDVETKRVRYLFQTRDYYFSLMFCVQWIFFLRPFALNVWIILWNPFLIFLNTWIVHALFINSEFCLWKINKCRLKKKKGKRRKWKRKRTNAKTKRVRYLSQTRDYYFSLMFCVQWIFFSHPFALVTSEGFWESLFYDWR